jgi:hypothetical protein
MINLRDENVAKHKQFSVKRHLDKQIAWQKSAWFKIVKIQGLPLKK